MPGRQKRVFSPNGRWLTDTPCFPFNFVFRGGFAALLAVKVTVWTVPAKAKEQGWCHLRSIVTAAREPVSNRGQGPPVRTRESRDSIVQVAARFGCVEKV